MTRYVGVEFATLRYMGLLVREAETIEEMHSAERFFVGYLAASRNLRAIKTAEHARFLVLINNARKLRMKELEAFQKNQKPARVPGPWAVCS